MTNNYVVYILEMSDGSLYTGITNDLFKRIRTHESGKGSKYVRAKLPIIAYHQSQETSKSQAMKLEYRIKQLKKEEKIKTLINYYRKGEAL